MKIFINKNTGLVIGTVDGFADDKTEGVMVVPAGLTPDDIETHVIGLGHPQEELARRLMDPRDGLDLRFLKQGRHGLEEMAPEEKEAVKEKLEKDKAEREAKQAELRDQPNQVQLLQQQIDDLTEKLKTKKII